MVQSAQQVALQEYIDAVHETMAPVNRLTDQDLTAHVWLATGRCSGSPVGGRGVSLITAALPQQYYQNSET